MIPTILQEVADYLSENDFDLVSSGQDARQDSSASETKIIQILQNSKGNQRWRVISPNIERRDNRAWYDAKIGDYYVDIKISECKSNDNTNAKDNGVPSFLGIHPKSVSCDYAQELALLTPPVLQLPIARV